MMSENSAKAIQYETITSQITALINDENDLIANLANIAAILKNNIEGFFWAGFYLLKNNELVLGPFQGPIACTRIPIGKGVCGTAVLKKESIIVPDVHKFPGHIACSELSKSEIVVPLISKNDAVGVLDIDSDRLNWFDQTDKKYLEKICTLIINKHY
jgi:GAF domain-containing protein